MMINDFFKGLTSEEIPSFDCEAAETYASDPNADPEIIKKLIEDSTVNKSRLIKLYCRNPNADIDLLKHLFNISADKYVFLEHYADNPRPQYEFLTGKEVAPYVNAFAVEYYLKRGVNEELIQRLLDDQLVDVNVLARYYAGNYGITMAFLKRLIKHPSLDLDLLMLSYERNPCADKDFLDRLNWLITFA